jgi:hypothetical protein
LITSGNQLEASGKIIVGEDYSADKELNIKRSDIVLEELITAVNRDKSKYEKDGHKVEITVKVVDEMVFVPAISA